MEFFVGRAMWTSFDRMLNIAPLSKALEQRDTGYILKR